MSAFVSPVPAPEPTPDAFGMCECGHRIYDHGRYGKDGNQIWAGCKLDDCDCTRFAASDGSQWPNTYGGATLDEPTDLDVNTDHWIDGQVYLTGDEPPL